MENELPQICSSSDLYKEWKEEQEHLIKMIKIDDSYITLDKHYHISLDRCDDARKILAWVHHLNEKIWFTPAICRRFIDLLVDKFKIDIHKDV